MWHISGGSAYPFAGHSSFCKLDSVLFPPSINQTPLEASQQGISERECAESRAGTGQREADKTLLHQCGRADTLAASLLLPSSLSFSPSSLMAMFPNRY